MNNTVEEGEPCLDEDCFGIYEYVQDGSCHCSATVAPCSSCSNEYVACGICELTPEEAEMKNDNLKAGNTVFLLVRDENRPYFKVIDRKIKSINIVKTTDNEDISYILEGYYEIECKRNELYLTKREALWSVFKEVVERLENDE